MFGGTPQSAPQPFSLHVGFEMCFLDTGESGDKWPLCMCINGVRMLPVSGLFKLYGIQVSWLIYIWKHEPLLGIEPMVFIAIYIRNEDHALYWIQTYLEIRAVYIASGRGGHLPLSLPHLSIYILISIFDMCASLLPKTIWGQHIWRWSQLHLAVVGVWSNPMDLASSIFHRLGICLSACMELWVQQLSWPEDGVNELYIVYIWIICYFIHGCCPSKLR